MSKQFERLYHAWVLEFRERYLRWAHPKARPWENTCRECDGKCNTPDSGLVLCDHCDAPYGYKCLNPPLKKPPKNAWHCPDCKPKLKSARGARMMSAVAENAARKRAELGDTPKRKVKQIMYLVKWAGLGYENCTWETKQDIGNSGLIMAFHKLNNSYPDEPDMPEEIVCKFLEKENHINPANAAGKFCIPDLRTQLYAQSRAFEFVKFALDPPEKVSFICGPKSSAGSLKGIEGPVDASKATIRECVSDMVDRVVRQDALPQLTGIKKNLPPLMAGEYDVVVPITSKGLLMNVGEVHGSVSFLGYRTFPDGSKGPAEKSKLIRNVGDKIIAVDGNSTAGLSFKEVIALLRESGKNQFSFMRFLESRYSTVNGELTSMGSVGRYAYTALRSKFSIDRRRLLVERSEAIEDDISEVADEEESDGSADADDESEDESDGSVDFQPESDDEEASPIKGGVAEQGSALETSNREKNTSSSQGGMEESTKAKTNGPLIRSENTRSLAQQLLCLDVGYSSDEGGDEDHAYFLDGVDDTFTAESTIFPGIPEAMEETQGQAKEAKVEQDSSVQKTLPVKRNEFNGLGERAKVVASVVLTRSPPDVERFDNFPEPSSKAIAEKQAEELAHANKETSSPDKASKRSTVKVEQVDIATNEIIHVWANAGAAAATLQIPLTELKQVLQGEYDEELGDEVGGFRWRFAAAGATVTAGLSDSKKNKKGKEAWLEFRDRLYDPNEPHPYKNGNRLRDYQVEGVNWLASTYYRKHGCILADGKLLLSWCPYVCADIR